MEVLTNERQALFTGLGREYYHDRYGTTIKCNDPTGIELKT